MGLIHRMIVAIEIFSRDPIHFRSAAELEFALTDGTAIGSVSVKSKDLFGDTEAISFLESAGAVDASALKLDPASDAQAPGECDWVAIQTEYGRFCVPESRLAVFVLEYDELVRTQLGVSDDADSGIYSPGGPQYCGGVLFSSPGYLQFDGAIIISPTPFTSPSSGVKKALIKAFGERGAKEAIAEGMGFGKGKFVGVMRKGFISVPTANGVSP